MNGDGERGRKDGSTRGGRLGRTKAEAVGKKGKLVRVSGEHSGRKMTTAQAQHTQTRWDLF